jgi:hypothetical protein
VYEKCAAKVAARNSGKSAVSALENVLYQVTAELTFPESLP